MKQQADTTDAIEQQLYAAYFDYRCKIEEAERLQAQRQAIAQSSPVSVLMMKKKSK